jgi:hypothetical protein
MSSLKLCKNKHNLEDPEAYFQLSSATLTKADEEFQYLRGRKCEVT